MKNLIALFIILCFSLSAQAQVRGDKNVVTKNFPMTNITAVVMELYAKVEIDCEAPEGVTITAEENLLEHIGIDLFDGKLVFDQKKWIKPSTDIIIKIGAPNLERIEQGTHDRTIVKNLNQDEFQATALVGDIVLKGQVKTLSANAEVGDIDALDLSVDVARVNVWSWGAIALGTPREIGGLVKKDGKVTYESGAPKITAKTKSGGRIKNANAPIEKKYASAKFIKVKIENNSSKRLQAYVKGPKTDGSHFSYGFPIRSGQIKKENWTVGTKVYRVNKLGMKKLLVEIKAEDEGKIVKLY